MKTLPIADRQKPPDEPPLFPRIGIVGCGLIGGSLAMAARQRWPGSLVIAVDRKDVLETAMRLHAVDVGGDDLVMVADADLIVLAAPVRQNIRILERLADYVAGPALVTDVGSTKVTIAEAARALPARLRFIGGHPLAGAAIGGISEARGGSLCRPAVVPCRRGVPGGRRHPAARGVRRRDRRDPATGLA